MILKKILLIIGIVLGAGILIIGIIYDLTHTPSKKKQPAPAAETSVAYPDQEEVSLPEGYLSHATDNNELTIGVPAAYAVSPIRVNSRDIFAATSSKVLLVIRKLPQQNTPGFTQEEAIESVHDYLKNSDRIQEGITYTTINKRVFGANNFVLVEGHRRSSDGYNTDYIRQYITYNGESFFYIDFVTAWTDAYMPTVFDSVASTVRFTY